jgi:hypothetical protein
VVSFQREVEGVPVFEDETISTFSYRAWGDLLSAIWSEEENKDYNYMAFYMSCIVKDNQKDKDEIH